jgi:hypothetical protein
MKRIAARIIAVCLLCMAGLPITSADMISPVPNAPEPPKGVQQRRQADGYPAYAATAGVVAVALSGSLIALRKIRKRSSGQ